MPTDFKPKRRTDRDTVAYAEFSGLRNDIETERFDASDLAIANNVDLNKARRISRRAGATRALAGAAHSLWSVGDLALCVLGSSLYKLNSSLVAVLLRTGITGAMSFARVNDNVYCTDGAVAGVVASSAWRTWGMDTPLATGIETVGDLVPGIYGVTATYVRSDGQESGARAMNFIVMPGSRSFAITVPASLDPTVTSKRIYMTTPDEEVAFCVAELANAAGAFTPTAAQIAAMNDPLETQFMGPAPVGQLVAYYKGRVFVAVGDLLFPSQPWAYELFDLRDYIQLDGDITMLAPMEDRSGDASGFFIGTTKSCGVLAGATPEDFKYTPKTDYGAIKGAVAFVDGALYLDGSVGARPLPMWLSVQGICVGLPNLEISNLTRSRYNFAADGVGAALFNPDTSMFLAVSGSNATVVMQIENQTLTTYTGYGYNSFARFAGKNLAADGSGVHELVGETDNGVPIVANVALGTTDFGSTFVKALDRLYVGYRSVADMNVSITLDGENTYPYVLAVSDQTGLATQRVKTGKGLAGRYWQFAIANIGGADFSFDTIDVKSAQLARRVNGRA